MKEQIRNTEVQINEEEIGKLPDKEFRMLQTNWVKSEIVTRPCQSKKDSKEKRLREEKKKEFRMLIEKMIKNLGNKMEKYKNQLTKT